MRKRTKWKVNHYFLSDLMIPPTQQITEMKASKSITIKHGWPMSSTFRKMTEWKPSGRRGITKSLTLVTGAREPKRRKQNGGNRGKTDQGGDEHGGSAKITCIFVFPVTNQSCERGNRRNPKTRLFPSIMSPKAAAKRVRYALFEFLVDIDILILNIQLGKEYASMQKEPPPFVWAVPDEKNILTCKKLAPILFNVSHSRTCRELHYCPNFSLNRVRVANDSDLSEDPQTRHTQGESTMVSSSFLRSTHSNHQE